MLNRYIQPNIKGDYHIWNHSYWLKSLLWPAILPGFWTATRICRVPSRAANILWPGLWGISWPWLTRRNMTKSSKNGTCPTSPCSRKDGNWWSSSRPPSSITMSRPNSSARMYRTLSLPRMPGGRANWSPDGFWTNPAAISRSKGCGSHPLRIRLFGKDS